MEHLYPPHTTKDGRTMIIRRLAADDAEEMIRFVVAIDSETRFLSREPGEFDATLEKERDFLAQRAQDPWALWLAAERNGKIVATCSVGRIRNQKRYRHRAAIGISVLKKYWGNGIGRRLMQESISWCKQRGFEQLELDVVADNDRAIALYKSFGFAVQGTVKHALKYADGTYGDEYNMYLPLR